jgi:sRNA-binding protein
MSSIPPPPAPEPVAAHPSESAPAPASAAPPASASASASADCAEQLRQRFPALFGAAPRPIKLKIHADIQARAPGVFSRQALSAFFRRYTMSTAYLIALTKATQRFDLDGAPAGELSERNWTGGGTATRRGARSSSRRGASVRRCCTTSSARR